MGMNGALWVTEHQGKMQGINSIGTACTTNPYCLVRKEDERNVCARCYADTYMKLRKSLKEKLEENGRILKNKLLEGRDIPVTNARIFRFESFGDLFNITHLKNYIEICKRNPFTNFALWTKNLWILDDLFNKEKIEKPDNLIIIGSSTRLNEQKIINREKYWMIDHIFTVYDKKYIENNRIEINCGAKNCLECQLCYQRGTDFYINEKLK